MYLEVTRQLPVDAASHYRAIMTILFARTAPCGRGEDGAAEITIKVLCGGALTGGLGAVPGVPSRSARS